MTGPEIETTGVSLSVIVPVPVTGAVLIGVDAASVIASVGSPSVSGVLGTRTMKLVAPAGTLTVGPAIGVKVVPPSNDTSAGWVSVPSVAVPEAGVSVTVVGVVLGFVSVTVKSRLPPSTMVGLVTVPTAGASLLVPPVPVPSSTIVVVDVAVPSVAPLGADRFTVKVSEPSKVVSLERVTVMVCEVTPGAKVSVPVAAVKSAAFAVPFAVA